MNCLLFLECMSIKSCKNKARLSSRRIHIHEKEFWFIIETDVRFFFSLLKSNFHNFFHYCKNEKQDGSHFPNQIYGLLKHIKKNDDLESKSYF